MASGACQKFLAESMKKATGVETEYAGSINSVDENGYPLIPVLVDGCWSRRPYSSNYNESCNVYYDSK